MVVSWVGQLIKTITVSLCTVFWQNEWKPAANKLVLTLSDHTLVLWSAKTNTGLHCSSSWDLNISRAVMLHLTATGGFFKVLVSAPHDFLSSYSPHISRSLASRHCLQPLKQGGCFAFLPSREKKRKEQECKTCKQKHGKSQLAK